MQQRRDRFSFVRAVIQGDRGNPEEMPYVGNPGLLPELAAVNSCGVDQRFFKLRRESHVLFFVVPRKRIVWFSAGQHLNWAILCLTGVPNQDASQAACDG